jgi:[ribosomal protein S18]-alanine N-acetyltransferase
MSAVAPMTPAIRLATPRDLPGMLAIERSSFSDPWSEEAFSTALRLDRMRVFVAEESGETHVAVGGAAARRLVGYVVALAAGAEADIADLAVASDARRRGIGRMLLERIIAELGDEGVQSVYLEVRESNRAARALYEAGGFAAVGVRRRYYRQPVEDALILRREVGPT